MQPAPSSESSEDEEKLDLSTAGRCVLKGCQGLL